MGYRGITHGGILASLLDETMGWAPSLANRRFCVTLELRVQYVKPVPLHTEVAVRGWVTGAERRIWEAEGEITDAGGAVFVRGSGRYLPVTEEQTRDVVDYLTFDADCVPPDRISRITR